MMKYVGYYICENAYFICGGRNLRIRATLCPARPAGRVWSGAVAHPALVLGGYPEGEARQVREMQRPPAPCSILEQKAPGSVG